MDEIVIGGGAYGIRCDMNVIEAIEEHFGSIAAITKERSISATKFLAAEMMNEHNYVRGCADRYTPEWVGANMTPSEYSAVWAKVISCFVECVGVKKK